MRRRDTRAVLVTSARFRQSRSGLIGACLPPACRWRGHTPQLSCGQSFDVSSQLAISRRTELANDLAITVNDHDRMMKLRSPEARNRNRLSRTTGSLACRCQARPSTLIFKSPRREGDQRAFRDGRITVIRTKGRRIGTVEAPDAGAAIRVAI